MTPADSPADQPQRPRLAGVLVAGAFVLLVAACFAYFWPVFVGTVQPYEDWLARMWLGGRWI